MPDERSPDLIALTRAFVAAWNRRDEAAIAAALHEEVVCTGIPLPPVNGRSATMTFLQPFLQAEAIDWEIIAIASSGNIVMTERVDRFRFTGQDWTAVRAAGIFEFHPDNRIIAWRDYFDIAELTAALPAQEDKASALPMVYNDL